MRNRKRGSRLLIVSKLGGQTTIPNTRMIQQDQATCETLLLEIGKDSSTPDPSGAATQGYEGQQAVFTDSSLQSAERND